MRSSFYYYGVSSNGNAPDAPAGVEDMPLPHSLPHPAVWHPYHQDAF